MKTFREKEEEERRSEATRRFIATREADFDAFTQSEDALAFRALEEQQQSEFLTRAVARVRELFPQLSAAEQRAAAGILAVGLAKKARLEVEAWAKQARARLDDRAAGRVREMPLSAADRAVYLRAIEKKERQLVA